MRHLFPPDPQQQILEPNQIYTVPELAFPSDGIEMNGGGRRPYIYFNMVSSVDGKATTVANNAAGLGSRVDFQLMGRLRLAADAVLAGAATVRRDPFVPNTRADLNEERARYFPDAPHPLGVTVSRDGNFPLDSKFFKDGPSRRIVFLHHNAPAVQEEALRERANVFRLDSEPDGQTDLGQMLNVLYEQFGVRRLLCEGGPSLNFDLLSKGFGDEFFWTLAAKIVGGNQNQTLVSGPGLGLSLENLVKLRLLSIYEQDSELFMRYKIEA